MWGCYCLLSRLPFFDLHFQVLWDLLAEERVMRMKVAVLMVYQDRRFHELVVRCSFASLKELTHALVR